jgi:hypothetical protein
MKEDGIGWACGMQARDVECIRHFSFKTWDQVLDLGVYRKMMDIRTCLRELLANIVDWVHVTQYWDRGKFLWVP